MAFDPVDDKNTQGGAKDLRIHVSDPQGYLTVSAVREWFDSTRKVTIFVDRDRSLLGFKRRSTDDGTTYTLSKKENAGADIALRTPLRKLDIDVDDITDSWQFPLEYDPDESLIVADLKELVETHTGCLHCPECGQRCKNETGLTSHQSHNHESNGRQTLEEMDPDELPQKPSGEAGEVP